VPATSDIELVPEDQSDLSEIPEKLLRLVVRRRWWILATASATALATIAVLLALPNRYTSEAIILVVQQQVPERYVTPTTTTDIASALQATTQEVLSRTRLLGIMDTFGLYAKEKKRIAPENVIALMRHNIDIQPLDLTGGQRAFNAFKISFTTDDPHLAQEVTSRLTSLFIQENLKTREDQASTTTNFLRAELESAKMRLMKQEQRLRDFKLGSLGELPEQQQGNLQILGGLQTQLQNTMASVARVQQQRLYLESLVRSDLTRLQSERTTLLRLYTPKHPRVVKIELEIAKKGALLESPRASKSPGVETSQVPEPTLEGTEAETAVDPLRSQLEGNRLEIENLSRDEKKLKAEVSRYQERLNLTPVREQQLAGILRDYELLKQNYADLLSKEQQSQLAMSLEKQQEGQHFRLVDPPSLPTVPSSPKRMKSSLRGAAAGVFLGLVLAFLFDTRDHSLKTEKEVNQHFSLPLVLGIPLVQTPFDERLHTWKRVFECLAGSVLVLAVAAAEFYVYRHG
jgi:succinoglycan biosynthesis transport protein ExoP